MTCIPDKTSTKTRGGIDSETATRRARRRAAGAHDSCFAGDVAEVAGVTVQAVYANARMLIRELGLPVAKVNGRWSRVE